jgi:predicted alpha/beta superfamily hydrolase
MNRTLHYEGRDIAVTGSETPEVLFLELTEKEQGTKTADHLQGNFLYIGFPVLNWNNELSPWEADPVFGKQRFGGKGRDLLKLVEGFLKEFREDYPSIPLIIGGYSLAGLFALWSVYESKNFDAVASASSSLWFEGWIDYASAHNANIKAAALGLGDLEEKTKNPLMKRVRECTEKQEELLRKQGIPVSFELYPGNHFQDPDKRMAKIFLEAYALLSKEGV